MIITIIVIVIMGVGGLLVTAIALRILGIAWISKRNVILAAAAFELIPCSLEPKEL